MSDHDADLPAALAEHPPFAPADVDLPTTPAELRERLPACDSTAYFNTGATGPTPDYLLDVLDDWNRYHVVDVLEDSDAYVVGFQAYEAIRERVAPFLGAAPAELALTESTADGLSAVVAALELGEGDVAVTTDLEHPAADVPLGRLERHHGVEIRTVETHGGRIDTDEFAAAVDGADLAVFSSLAWNYGTRLPVSELVEIADDAGAFTVVDAVQEPGQCPVDVSEWDADAVVGSGHKWLLGVWGAGFLTVDEEALSALAPAQVGYRSVTEPNGAFQLKPSAARFERGTTAIGPHVALTESIRTFEAIGVETVRAEILRLTDRLVDQLPDERVVSPTTPETGLVTVDVPEPETTVDRLGEADIAVRSLPDPDCVRASVHAFLTNEEVDRLATALAEAW